VINRLTLWLIFAELLAFVAWASRTSWNPRKGAGAIVILVSCVLLLAARTELGRSFAIRARASHLVTTGIYARLRNPIYLFSGSLFVGVALLIGSWWPVLIVALLVPLQRRRIRAEERVLTERFGEEYLRYRRSTWL
jgi:protein-S-isoprenylcysteine O-methyltransferase Ste14